MKATLTSTHPIQSIVPVPFEAAVPIVCSLSLASLLAIVGGIATSAWFFGLLLVFALLLLASCYLSSPNRQSIAGSRSK